MYKRIRSFILLNILVVPVLATATAIVSTTAIAEEADARAQLTVKLEAIQTLSADFLQESVGSDGRIRTESGSLQIKRPGLFRWDTRTPFEQEIVSRNQTIWMVDRDLMQVIIQNQDARMANTPAQLLSGDVKAFLTSYQIGLYKKSDLEKYTLMPQGQSDLFDKLDILFRKGQLSAIELRDSLGGRRRLDLNRVTVNGQMDDSVFKVDVPEGYDVIDQTLSAGKP